MRHTHLGLGMVALVALCGCEDADPIARYSVDDVTTQAGDMEQWSFDDDAAGALPANAELFKGDWTVTDQTLCQTANEDYPSVALSDEIYGDATLTTRFLPISGETDQAAGILFRVQDADNHYIVRANALEGNVAFYIYGDGGREQMGKDGFIAVENGVWQELKVEVRGNTFTAYINGEEALTHTDDSYTAGRMGLWTKADSHTCFDDVVAIAE